MKDNPIRKGCPKCSNLDQKKCAICGQELKGELQLSRQLCNDCLDDETEQEEL